MGHNYYHETTTEQQDNSTQLQLQQQHLQLQLQQKNLQHHQHLPTTLISNPPQPTTGSNWQAATATTTATYPQSATRNISNTNIVNLAIPASC